MKSPKVTNFKINKLAANYAQLVWDNVGDNFYYIIEYRVISNPDNPISQWQQYGYFSDTSIWIDNLSRNTYYQFRIKSVFEAFGDSEWSETEIFQTFLNNAYDVSTINEFRLSNPYITNRLLNNDNTYVDFNDDQLLYSLMIDDFQYDNDIENVSTFSDEIITENEIQKIRPELPVVCSDIDRVEFVELDNVLYAMERYQRSVKVSNDNGQNWVTYNAFNDRVGNPVSQNVAYQNSLKTFVLGYDRIFEGVSSEEIKFSNVDINWSNQTVTFADVQSTNEIGFPVEIFGELAKLPNDIKTIAEAFAASDDYLYVAARDNIYKLNLTTPTIDSDTNSPTFGEPLFESDITQITGDSLSVVKKMEWFNDKLYLFVTGKVKTDEGVRLDPTIKDNIEDSVHKGVYEYDEATGTVTRVYGNTEDDRAYINHIWCDMSRDPNELFIDLYNWKMDTIVDSDLPLENEQVDSAVKYDLTNYYVTDKSRRLICLRTENGVDWNHGAYEYYNETKFTWLARDNDRCWKTNSNKALTVYSEKVYTFELNNTSESFDSGVWTMKADDIVYSGLSQYSGGVLIHKTDGSIVGYIQFPYRVRDEIEVVWKPDNTVLIADITGQTRPTPPSFESDKLVKDPTLVPLLDKMSTESYMSDDTLYRKFCEQYLMFISEGDYGYYQKMYNIVKNIYPKEEDSQLWLWSEIRRRNIYVDKDKREAVTRFFETRKNDFYSKKGTEASYKFLFKLLYDADVDIEVESKNNFEYDIIVDSENITEDIVGTPISTPTGIANVTYIDRQYENGLLRWRVTIHNFYGKFYEGQTIESKDLDFDGTIVRGVKGKQLASDSREYLERGRSLYVMKIKSEIPTSWYKDDVIRFVHPVGFGFLGITLITVLINSGISIKHLETIVNKYKALRFDMGLPLEYIDEVPVLDEELNIQFDQYGNVITQPHPNAGQAFPLTPDYLTDNPELVWGLDADERRRTNTPMWDSSWATYADLFRLADLRLKDNIGNPYDPENPTQVKVNE
ncbi:MAG: baseplate wedge subunit [Acidobacteria bacterium]|nr:baseplate wedge subunit [Acidobacteriota bacterium]|tara:strand:- start:1719 stop:4757 length:3039 start_codon:yes stop_codon:yes gene_type:complete